MTDARKLGMPDEAMVERGMTKAQRDEHRRKLKEWRESKAEEGDDGSGSEPQE